MTGQSLSAAQARRIALRALGLDRPRPATSPSRRSLASVAERLGLVQIDSVNVLARAHLMPFFSRLGGYEVARLEQLAYGSSRGLFEYWGHEASLIPLDLQPALRWRMRRAAEQFETWGGMARLAIDKPEVIEAVLARVAAEGPVTAGELAGARERPSGPWWDWREEKVALEFLFWSGRVTTATRRNFERVYDLTERVLPAEILTAPTPDDRRAHATLVERAARALGVATAGDLARYFRLAPAEARQAVQDLVDEGVLIATSIEGWRGGGYLHRDATLPRQVSGRALISPFDPMAFERDRLGRIFGFDYRIEIYTPAHKRVHGYYVLPFLDGDRLTCRVDLKADRSAGQLLVRATHVEPDCGFDPQPLAAELVDLAQWLGADRVVVERRGDGARALAAALAATG